MEIGYLPVAIKELAIELSPGHGRSIVSSSERIVLSTFRVKSDKTGNAIR